MSYEFWGMAVRADRTAVLEALHHWPNEREARLEPCSGDVDGGHGWLVFAMASHGAWTVFSFAQGLIPGLALHLSRALSTRVISVDQAETIGYEHFSVLDAGSVSRVFTREMEVEDNIGVDLRDFYEQAKQSGKVRLPPEYEESEMESEAFHIFNVVVSEINVEDIAADLEEPNFRMWAGADGDRALATLTKTGRGEGPWWRDLV